MQATHGALGTHTGNIGGSRRRDTGGRRSGTSGAEPQERQIWWSIRHEVGGPEGVVERVIKGDGPSGTLVATVGKTHLEDLRGRGGVGGGGVVSDGFPPKREGGVIGG